MLATIPTTFKDHTRKTSNPQAQIRHFFTPPNALYLLHSSETEKKQLYWLLHGLLEPANTCTTVHFLHHLSLVPTEKQQQHQQHSQDVTDREISFSKVLIPRAPNKPNSRRGGGEIGERTWGWISCHKSLYWRYRIVSWHLLGRSLTEWCASRTKGQHQRQSPLPDVHAHVERGWEMIIFFFRFSLGPCLIRATDLVQAAKLLWDLFSNVCHSTAFPQTCYATPFSRYVT